MSSNKFIIKGINLTEFAKKSESSVSKFDKVEHDSKSRLEITKLFLYGYFTLIGGGFIFSLLYNWLTAYINHYWLQQSQTQIAYLDVANTVSIITTTLSSAVGFLIGYYFKNKNDKD